MRQISVRMAAIAALVVLVAACDGGGGANESKTTDAETTTDAPKTTDEAPAAGDAVAYCQLIDELDPSALMVLDADSSPEQVIAAAGAFLDANAEVLSQITASAPEEIADAYGITLETFQEIARTGDLSLLTEPAAVAADQAVRQYQAANC